ncbi:MAG: glycosyltransferase family 4 protein [Planctomycetota bacterium]
MVSWILRSPDRHDPTLSGGTPEVDPRVQLVILNHYYVPDVASTGHLLSELAEELAQRGDFNVGVITCRPCYGPPETWLPAPQRERRDGVYVRRLEATRFSKDRLWGRLTNYATFMVPLGVRQFFRAQRRRVYLYTTNPPFLGIIGALTSMIRRHTYVMLLHDAFPQMAVWVGTIREGGVIDRVWHFVNRLSYRRAKATIVLCERAKDLICDTYAVPRERVHVVPNWADGTKLFPVPKLESEFAKAQGLVEPFTVLYSGNLGLYYEFETLLDAAELLKGEAFRLVFVGAGGKRDWIESEIKRRGLENTLLLPYQPFESLNDSLNACDASLVTITHGIEGISFPSKLYSSLAVGKPILALSEERSELRSLVQGRDVGYWFRLGDAENLALIIRRMMADPAHCAEQGERARKLFEERYTLEVCASRYADILAGAWAEDIGPVPKRDGTPSPATA